MIPSSPILVIDETLREGMQYRGLVFSADQRRRILEFQESLGVDICQAGYPPAHESEIRQVKYLLDHAREKGFAIRIAAMGRAFPRDAAALVATGVRDFHLHAHIRPEASPEEEDRIFREIGETLAFLRHQCPNAVVSMAMLDIGRTPVERLRDHARRLTRDLGVDILSLPDTSGILAPNRIGSLIQPIVHEARGRSARIGVHCHNDMGMASANTVMGVAAGATVLEATALGIGERNGLADLFTTAKTLADQGVAMNLKTWDVEGFRAYYTYLAGIVRDQTGEDPLTPGFPFFGSPVRTHVAGTHGTSDFGLGGAESFFLNILCGRDLVKKYLMAAGIPFETNDLGSITEAVKTRSATLGRRLADPEIRAIAAGFLSPPADPAGPPIPGTQTRDGGTPGRNALDGMTCGKVGLGHGIGVQPDRHGMKKDRP